MRHLLNNTSVQDLDSTIQCANINGRPFDLKTLMESLAAEWNSTSPRVTIIKRLEREIKRQEKLK